MNRGIAWASWISFARYGYSALIINEYAGRDIPCLDDGEASIAIGTGVCPLPGEEVIASLGITGVAESYWFNIGMTIGLQVMFRIAAYIFLRRAE
jgi:hypothetical protein